jgi:hydrogenase expression/formation protein HypE
MTLRPGKLPTGVLAGLLARIEHRDPRVLLGPGTGRDAALIDFGDRVLVAKTDPVTFATDEIGWYAVNVNANDIACMGARPSWFLATALLPPGAPDSLPAEIFAQLQEACGALGVELVGGHTEVTIGLSRPIIAGAMLGEARPGDIVRGDGITPGDAILMSKPIAIEGTALLAREARDDLAARGVDAATLDRAAAMLRDPGISVVADAQRLTAATRPRLMHDATEGGIATALAEMALAAGATLRIDRAAVQVRRETEAMCHALGLDPLGLLASGTLLAIVDEAAPVTRLQDARTWTRIGTVEPGPPKVIMHAGGSTAPCPTFDRDELARYFDRVAGVEGAPHEQEPEGSSA